MTEAEWLTCSDPKQMLYFLSGKASNRRLRLFACACCRRIWIEMKDERSRQAVIVAERYADHLATKEELEAASDGACAVWDSDTERASTVEGILDELGEPLPYSAAAYNVAIPLGWWGAATAFVAPYEIILDASPDREVEGTRQCDILRDIFANPLRPVTIDPRSVTSTVVDLARVIYEDRAFERMPVLADALKDAGCNNEEIIVHCRSDGPHVRGCWVVDLLLGKK